MDASFPQNHYRTLNVPNDADLATIRSAHRKLVLSCHPDNARDGSEKEQRQRAEQFHQVQQAYEILSDDNRRRHYDQVIQQAELKEGNPVPSPPWNPHKKSIRELETLEHEYELADFERPDSPICIFRNSSHSPPTYHSDQQTFHCQIDPRTSDPKFSGIGYSVRYGEIRFNNGSTDRSRASTDSDYFTGNPSVDGSMSQVTRCPVCPSMIFAGSCQKSNLRRHVRERHSDVQRLDCFVPGCTATFSPRRKDARLMHMRKTHSNFPLPAPSSMGKLVSKASDANNVGLVEGMTTISDDTSTTSASDDASMESSNTKESSSCSDDEGPLGQSEDGILDDPGAHIEYMVGHPKERVFNLDEKMVTSMSHLSANDALGVITSQVLATLLTRKAERHDAFLNVEWDIMAFMEDQFRDPESPTAVAGSVITISGSAQHAQATTCSEYVRQRWTAHGSRVLDALQDALHDPNHTSRLESGACIDDVNTSGDVTLPSRASVEIEVSHKGVSLNIKSGTPAIITDVVQQLAWMGAALRTSADGQVQYCEPKLEQVSKSKRGEPAALNITFEMSSLSEEDQSCWLPLFANPVIARGFPVPERKNGERGLEIPLEIMAALGGARHAMDFEGGLVLKGYSTLFVPVKRYQDSVQWHLICATGENRVSFSEVSTQYPNRALLKDLNHDELKTTRTFLGLWKVAETHLATADADYDVDWSKAEEAGPSFRFTGGTLGFSKVVTAQINFVLGAKDGPYHHSQQGPFQKTIDHAEKFPVVLYDQKDRRAWLVSALAVILHMIQLRHHIKPFVVDGDIVQISPTDPSRLGHAAREAVAENKSKKLFDCETDNEKDYCFRDAMLDYSSILDGLVGREATKQVTPGKEVHTTLQHSLYGWEFRDVTDEESLLKQKTQVLRKTAGRWYDLVKGAGAVVLFASGFGDIIRPTSESAGLCRKWGRLPKDHDYLAVCIPMLETFYTKAGHRQDHQYLTSAKHVWHRGSMIFEHCTDADSDCCNCDRLQQVYHDSYRVFRHWKPPGSLEANGCVMFGQAHHPFKPLERIDMRHNPIHMLPNTPIQTGRTNRHSPTEDDCLLSPPPAASVSLEPEETNGHAIRNSKIPPSPLLSTDLIMHDKTIALRRKRKLPHIQRSESIICEGHNICNDGESSCDDSIAYSTGYQSFLEHDRKSKRQGVASTQTVCASQDEYETAHVQRSMWREAKVEHYGHPFGCSCTVCPVMDCEPPGRLKMIGTITGAQRSSTGMIERRER